MTLTSGRIPMGVPTTMMDSTPEPQKVGVLRQPTKLLNQMKLVLEKDKKKTLELIRETKKDLRQTSSTSSNDEANQLRKEELSLILEPLQKKLVETQLALDRIAVRTYGVCTKTKQLIPWQRLVACPTATTCV